MLTGRMSTLTASHMPAERKDPHEEYFKMSLVSFKLNHPTEAELLKVDPDKLYREVKRTGLPFFKWSDWLADYLSKSLAVREKNRHEAKLAKARREDLEQSSLAEDADVKMNYF